MKGHIRKRNGRYYVELEADREHDSETGDVNRRRIGGGGFRTRREADDALRDALEAGRRGWRGPSRITLGAYIEQEWLPGVRLSRAPTTAALYTTLMTAYVIPRLGGRRLDSLGSADLTGMYAELLEGGARGGRPLSPTSVRQIAASLKQVLREAERAKHITWNPADAAKAPRKAERDVPAAWTAEELRRFLDHAAGDRLEALWILAATSGMRRSELLGLRWSDVDLEGAELRVRQASVAYGGSVKTMKEPKTAASRRTLPLEARAIAALRRHAVGQKAERLRAGGAFANDGDLVFVDEIGDPLPPERVSKAFRRLVKSSGLRAITLHGLRHTFATVALDNDVDVLYVAEALGHASPSITQDVYQHTRPERKAEAIDKVGRAIFG